MAQPPCMIDNNYAQLSGQSLTTPFHINFGMRKFVMAAALHCKQLDLSHIAIRNATVGIRSFFTNSKQPHRHRICTVCKLFIEIFPRRIECASLLFQ